MRSPDVPADEAVRLARLRSYEALDTPPEQALDDLTKLARYVCGAPIALISLVDEHRQWFKSKIGWAVTETSRDLSFCAHAINQPDFFIVPDATKDERFSDNPLVTADPSIRFYAGAPLVTSEGYALGTLCVIDRIPRELSAEQTEALRTLSRQVMAQLELRRQARTVLESEAKFSAAFHGSSVCIAIAALDGKLVEVNPAMCELTGFRRHELLGKTMIDLGLVTSEARAEILDKIADAGGSLRDVEWVMPDRHGVNHHIIFSMEEILLSGVPHRLSSGVDMTGRRKAEAARRVSDENLRKIIDGLSPNIFVGLLSPDGTMIEVGRPGLAAAGLKSEDVLGRRFDQTYWWSHSEPARAQLRAAMTRAALGAPSRYDVQVRATGDTLIWIDFSIHPVRDADGKVIYLVPSANVIDERVRAQEAQRESLERFQAVARATNDAVWDWDLSANTLWWNDNFQSLFGYGTAEIEAGSESWLNRVHPEDKDRVSSSIQEVIRGRQNAWWEEYRFRRKDGTYAEIFDRGYVLRNAEGVGVRMVGTMQDITERKQAERRLLRLNRTYAVLSEINQLIVRERKVQAILEGACRIAVEKGGFLLAWIGRAENETSPLTIAAHAGATKDTLDVLEHIFTGCPPGCAFTEQALATGAHSVSNDIARDPLADSWREAALQRGYRAMVSLPFNVAGKREGVFNLYADQSGFFDAEELQLLDGLAMDISFAVEGCERERERQTAIEQLRASEERFRELAETVNEVFWITDPGKAKVLFVNKAYERIWGRSCASLYASPQSWLDSIHPDDRARIVAAKDLKQKEGSYDETYRILRADGTTRWIHDRAFPVYNEAGEILRVVGTTADITNRRRLEEQLRHSQKMEAIGQLAGGVAHDFNNILTAVVMQVELSSQTKGLSRDMRDGLQMIRSCAERATNLTRQLLLFSHKQVMQPRTLDLNDVVTSLARMLPRLIEENVRLALQLAPKPLPTYADAGMIDQVIMNLAVNARDAMPNGGVLLIATEERFVDAELARLHPEATPGRHVCLRVSDTGSGIAPEILPRIFEPFFTTKAQGKGTGLGLATVFGIIRQHQGWMKVNSELGRGTVFEIYLPAVEMEQTTVATLSRTPQREGAETILLVEDEPAVRQLTRVVLERAGYQVHEAADGVEAREIWAANRDSIDLLYTDLVMPGGVSGHELAAGLQSEKPTLRVIYSSGYSADLAAGKLKLEEGLNFIQKPSSPQNLVDCVRRALDQ